MNKIVLICGLLIYSISSFAQKPGELISSFTEKGKSYIGFDLGYDGRFFRDRALESVQ